jgi:hypothetical protein
MTATRLSKQSLLDEMLLMARYYGQMNARNVWSSGTAHDEKIKQEVLGYAQSFHDKMIALAALAQRLPCLDHLDIINAFETARQDERQILEGMIKKGGD